MALQLGGTVSRTGQGEYGRTELTPDRRLTPLPGLAGHVERVDEPRRCHHGGARRLHADRHERRRAGGGDARYRAPALRAAVPPRGRAHRPGQRGLRPLPHRRLRLPAGLDARLHHRAAGGGGAGAGGHGPSTVRAERWRRLGCGGGAGAQGGGRPADLCLRRHGPDALGRGRSGRGHLPPPIQDGPRPREGGRPLLRRSGGRDGSGTQAKDHRRAVHPDLRGGGARPRRRLRRRAVDQAKAEPPARARVRASWSRARSTPT